VSSIGDPTADSIQGKWIKKYETQHPIELLAYYGRHPTIPEAFWLGPVQSFVDANWTFSPFRKVWICDPGSKRILFAASRDKYAKARGTRWSLTARDTMARTGICGIGVGDTVGDTERWL
jgi:hypothetical protein